MESPNTSRQNKFKKGFTLFEAIIVLAIMGVIIALATITTFDSYEGYVFRSERSTLVTILERARSRAMNNYGDTTHGVCITEQDVILFRGNTCVPSASTSESIARNNVVKITGLSSTTPVIYEQLTGRITPQLSSTTDEIKITLTEGRRSSKITINNAGRINW